LQADIPVDSFVMSKFGLGLDNMLRSYLIDEVSNLEMEDAFVKHTNWDVRKTLCNCLFRKTRKNNRKRQNTQRNHCYCRWFYGPQGRILRLNIQDESLNSKWIILSLKRTELLISKWKLQQYMVFRLF
jgi:uridine phosphorylase